MSGEKRTEHKLWKVNRFGEGSSLNRLIVKEEITRNINIQKRGQKKDQFFATSKHKTEGKKRKKKRKKIWGTKLLLTPSTTRSGGASSMKEEGRRSLSKSQTVGCA